MRTAIIETLEEGESTIFGNPSGKFWVREYEDGLEMSGRVKATSGEIGGFGISATTVSSSNNNLILKSSGQITASAVSMSGTITADSGQIGGFQISGTQLKQGT